MEKQSFEDYPELASHLLHAANNWKTDGNWSATLEQINNVCKELTDIKSEITKLIKIQEKSAIRYKACFGKENTGGEQIYEYFAMLLKKTLSTN